MLVIGHRGCGAGATENTLFSFRRAIELGADGVELDVRSTADGMVVVHHDPVVAGFGPIHRLRAEQLPPHIPNLEQVLGLLSGVVVDIEVKNSHREIGHDPTEATSRRVAEIVARMNGPRQSPEVCVSSFSLASLDPLRDSALSMGLVIGHGANFLLGLRRAFEHGCSAVHAWRKTIGKSGITIAHELGIEVWAWTVDTPRATAQLRDAGADALITNRIQIARETLSHLGEEDAPRRGAT